MNIFNNHFYINLDERKDRKEFMENELKKLDIIPNRIKAIKMKSGNIGCSLSHIKCIEQAIKNNWDYVTIFEDDIQIIKLDLLKKKVNELINKDFDILLLSGNNFKPFDYIDNDHIKVNKCFTTGSYIIKKHYYNIYLNNLKEGAEKLIKSNNRDFSLDVYSHILQKKDKWFLLIPICIIQIPNYSDIEKTNVDYTKLMLNWNK